MKQLSFNEIRQKYLDFFMSKQHKIVASDSLIPEDGSTLFTTAGMQQFKPQFMGQITDFTRASTSQKCMRTDDLDEVGVTDFHHTFFEMLGNFSFGDYFKKEAIAYAWEFLTEVLEIPSEKLWVSVHEEDNEAYQIWLNDIKIPANKIVKLGDKDNFWPANARVNGPNGPCGPCSEIFFDWGAAPELGNEGDDPGTDQHGRFCEIWNLVFTQYNRKEGGVLEPLPSQNIDTGMGLERLTAVMQGKHNNFETDIFTSIIESIEVNIPGLILKNKRVIADHIRAISFAISDGIVPSNKEHGSVIKKLIDSCSVLAFYQGINEPVIYKVVKSVIDLMGAQYPELKENQKIIEDNVKRFEELNLQKNVENIPQLEKEVEGISGKALGEIIFKFHDTYGLTLNASLMVLKNKNVDINDEAFSRYEELMEEQKERARSSSKMQGDVFTDEELGKGLPKTEFVGYDTLTTQANIVALYVNGQSVDAANKEDEVIVVLDQTSFYAESGGQVGDIGFMTTDDAVLQVTDTKKKNDIYFHTAIVDSGMVKVGDEVCASVSDDQRLSIQKNHTATHLLQAALTKVLGDHVKQQGSLVDEDRLRFDFTQPKAITPEQIAEIEKIVNANVSNSDDVMTEVLPIEDAKKKGARAYFGDKYGDVVRIVSIGDYSMEFCGGTHVKNTADIGAIKITSQSAVAQGIRRIEAVTGEAVEEFNKVKQNELWEMASRQLQKIEEIEAELRNAGKETSPFAFTATPESETEQLEEIIQVLQERAKKLTKDLGEVRFITLKDSIEDVIAQAEVVSNSTVVSIVFDGVDMAILRRLSDIVKAKTKSCVALLGATTEDAGSLIVAVSDDLVEKGIKAGDIVKEVAPLMGGSGGGRPQMAQAGSKEPEKINSAIDAAKNILKEKLA